MCNWTRWVWPGILAVVILTALAIMYRAGNIEEDLSAKAKSELSGQSWAEVTLDGRDLTISGTAPTQEAMDEAMVAVDNTYDLRKVETQVTLQDAIIPYIFGASKHEGKIILSGHVPDEEAKTSLVEQANSIANGDEVVDELKIGVGEPKDFLAKAGFAITSLKDLTSGSAKLTDTKYVIRGDAATFAEFEAITQGLNDTLPEGTNLSELAISSPPAPEPEPEPVSPYTFALAKDDGTLTLTGHVPDEKTQASLLGQAIAISQGAEVVDELIVAPGAPDGFRGKAGYAIDALKDLVSGSAELSDNKYVIRGEADSFEKFEAITKGLNDGLPEGTNMGELAITSPPAPEPEPEPEPEVELPPLADPYRWSLSKTFAGVVVSGYANSDEEIQETVANVKTKLDVDEVENKLLLATGAADNFNIARGVLIDQVSKLEAGQGNIIGQSIHVAGRAPNAQIKDEIAQTLANNLPSGFKGTSNVIFIATVPTPKPEATTCVGRIGEAAKIEEVRFELNSSRVANPSAVLDAVIVVMKDCDDKRLQIQGHTDSRGDDLMNRQLSESRAASVRNYLVNGGLERGRIDIKGFGSSQPIASNDTDEGQALNRRIEILVLE